MARCSISLKLCSKRRTVIRHCCHWNPPSLLETLIPFLVEGVDSFLLEEVKLVNWFFSSSTSWFLYSFLLEETDSLLPSWLRDLILFLLDEVQIARVTLLCGFSHPPICSRKSPRCFLAVSLSLYTPWHSRRTVPQCSQSLLHLLRNRLESLSLSAPRLHY